MSFNISALQSFLCHHSRNQSSQDNIEPIVHAKFLRTFKYTSPRFRFKLLCIQRLQRPNSTRTSTHFAHTDHHNMEQGSGLWKTNPQQLYSEMQNAHKPWMCFIDLSNHKSWRKDKALTIPTSNKQCLSTPTKHVLERQSNKKVASSVWSRAKQRKATRQSK